MGDMKKGKVKDPGLDMEDEDDEDEDEEDEDKKAPSSRPDPKLKKWAQTRMK